jgi:hypothetical protein
MTLIFFIKGFPIFNVKSQLSPSIYSIFQFQLLYLEKTVFYKKENFFNAKNEVHAVSVAMAQAMAIV